MCPLAGFPAGSCSAECWTLISTAAFAVAEISAVPMKDASTGASPTFWERAVAEMDVGSVQ